MIYSPVALSFLPSDVISTKVRLSSSFIALLRLTHVSEMGKEEVEAHSSQQAAVRNQSFLPYIRFSWRRMVIAIVSAISFFSARRLFYPWPANLSQKTLTPDMLEVSSLLGDLYELLVDMTYFDRSSNPIDYPPHGPSRRVNTTLATQLGLHPLAIQLLQSLPYLSERTVGTNWGYGAGDMELLLNGAFADFRDDDSLERSRDPLYAGVNPLDKNVGWDEEHGQYMKPWYIPLNQLGNHGVVLILNLKNNHLWVIDQESGDADPALLDIPTREMQNKNSLDMYPSRPARDVLRDFIKKFKDLEWIPGGLSDGSHEYEHYKRLYLEHGWPNTFDATAFNISRMAWEEAEEERYSAEHPFREVKTLEYWWSEGQRCDVSCRLDQLEKDNARPEWHGQFADPKGGKIVYEARKKELKEQLATEPKRRAELLKQLEEAKARLREVPEEVRKARADRLRKYGE
jgi:hypothetical protein